MVYVSGVGDSGQHSTTTYKFTASCNKCRVLAFCSHANNYWTHGKVILTLNNSSIDFPFIANSNVSGIQSCILSNIKSRDTLQFKFFAGNSTNNSESITNISGVMVIG